MTHPTDTAKSEELKAGGDDLRHKLWMIISHATGGQLSNLGDVDRSTNDICVRISAFRSKLYQAGKDAAAPCDDVMERLRIMAKQKTSSELDEDERDAADWQGAYDWLCGESRVIFATLSNPETGA